MNKFVSIVDFRIFIISMLDLHYYVLSCFFYCKNRVSSKKMCTLQTEFSTDAVVTPKIRTNQT